MSQKFKFRLNKSGYLQIDIAFAVLIFFIFFLLIYSYSRQEYNSIDNIYEINRLEMDARDVCYLLTSSSGYPSNWESIAVSNVSFFGLKSVSSSSLDENKINAFNVSSYFVINDKINEETYLYLRIIGLESSTEYLSFGVNPENSSVSLSSYVCYAVYNSEIVKVMVEVWG